MAKIINSIRVGMHHWEKDEDFEALFAYLCEYKDCIQQVALFSTHFHPPMPLETAKHNCDILRSRLERLREAGFSAGINILATVGHHPERMDETVQGDWTYNTNIDGEVCLGSRCMNNPAYLEEYVGPLYRIHCDVKPDFIWIDDDVRAGHLPVGFCCFCDNCIAKFNKDYKHEFTREQLKAALHTPENVELRKEWLCHQTDKYVALLAYIRKTVNECDDSIMLGMMTGERYFEGYDFAAWAEALSDGGKYEIMWRPGGGSYNDTLFNETFDKSSQNGRQCANLPSYVTEVQYELESCPCRPMDKSPRYTALETLMALSTGCTGNALNFLPKMRTADLKQAHGLHMDEIRKVLPFATKLSNTLGRASATGIHCGWHIHSQAVLKNDFAYGYAGCLFNPIREVYYMGVPESFEFDKSSVYLLFGDAPYAFGKDELETMLSRGVCLDSGAVNVLHELGYGDLVGFSVGRSFQNDSEEVYTDHPFNEGFVGGERRCYNIFNVGDSCELIPAEGALILSELRDFRGERVAACSSGVFENRLGGRVYAASHYPTTELHDWYKTRQLKRVFRYLSNDTLPLVVESYHRVRAVARPNADGFAATLLNTTPDVLTDVTVLLPASVKSVTVTEEAMNETTLIPVAVDGNMNRYVIPTMAPFSMLLLSE